MNWIKMSNQFLKEQYDWLKNHSLKLGESMNSIVRRAVMDYKEKVDKNIKS